MPPSPFDPDAKPFTLAGHSTRALVTACYDGDSFKAVFPMPGGTTDFLWTCRVLGIDTPEIRGKSQKEKAWARAARDRLRALLLDQEVRLELSAFDKYGRVLAQPFLLDDTDVAQLLIGENLGRAYLGVGTKADWAALEPPVGVAWRP